MLCAFTARPIIELRQRDKSKIESILANGDRVFVGLNTGALRVYRLNELPPLLASHSAQPANGGPVSASTPLSSSVPTGSSAVEPPSSVVAQSPQRAAPPAASAPKPTDLLREVDKFAPRAVEQLAIIKEANTLVSLSNYAVSLHDLHTLEPIEAPLARSRNASVFAVTSNIVKDAAGIPEIISRLAVAVKRRLLLWSWRESELSGDVVEVVLAEAIRTVTWASATRLVCGMNAGYVLIDAETQAVEDIVAGQGPMGGAAGGPGSRFGAVSSASMGYMGLGGYMPKPLSARLVEGQLLLAKDINTLFVDDQGKPLEKRQIPWQAAPEAIGYSYPYIVALQSPTKGSLEVRSPDTLSLLQTIALPGAAQLHFPPPTVSLAHAGKGFYISSERVVWKMEATDYDTQIDELVASTKFDEAVSLLNMLEDALLRDKTQTLREVKMQKAEMLFRQKKYRDSMDLFNEDDVDAPPQRVLRLFPRFIAGDLSGHAEEKDDEEDEDEDENENEKDGDNDSGGPENGEGDGKPNGDKTAATEPGADAASPAKGGAGAGAGTGTGSGITRLLLGHRKANSDTASIASAKKGATDAENHKKASERQADDPPPLSEKDLKAAVSALNSYLVGARTRLQRVLDPATGKLKPRPSGSGGPDEAFKSLLLHSKDESDEQLEKQLQNIFRIVDTALFRAYMYSVPGLTSSLFRIPNYCDPDVVNETLLEASRYNELVDFFYGKKLHKQALEVLKRFGASEKPDPAAPNMHGPQRTVLYLQNLPPELVDLTLEFAEWTLKADPELGMEVFLADTENAETLPRDKVIRMLARVDPALERKYLEHIIWELNDMTPGFHNRLVELYVSYLKEKPRGEEWDGVLEHLIRLLKESRQYSLTKAFGLLPRDDPSFYEAQAVVLSNMGQHKQALEIYVFKMKDHAKAEEYCNRIHKSQEAASSSATDTTTGARPESSGDEAEAEPPPSIYHILLALYLTPPSPHQPSLGPALELLSKHGSRLPAVSTLSLVPDALPMRELESYFRGRMRSANSVVNETRIVAGLRKAQLVASQAALLLGDGGAPGGQSGRNRRVVVGEERVCGVCHKRLGGSVVAVLPDNSVAHYGCLNRVAGQGGALREAGTATGPAARRPSWGWSGRS